MWMVTAPIAISITADRSLSTCRNCAPATRGFGESLILIRPSFRLIEFSSHASDLASMMRRSPLGSTQAFNARSPLPSGIDPEQSLLGKSQTTLY